MILQLLAEAEAAGAASEKACAILGLSARTVERWRGGAEEDLRRVGVHKGALEHRTG